MSVNRRFGYDANDPAQESVNLNVEPSQGAGSTYKVFVAAAALERGIRPWHTITTSDPYVSRVYKNGDALRRPQRGPVPPTLTMTEALSARRTPTSSRWTTSWAASRVRSAWRSGWACSRSIPWPTR